MSRYSAVVVAALMFSSAVAVARADDVADARKLVGDSSGVITQLQHDQHFWDLMKRAKGAFIVPHLGEGALVAGGSGGSGILLRHEANGWSNPAFLNIGSISVGAQAGGKAGPVVMLLMTDKAVESFTQANNLSLNANAGLTVVNYSAKGQAPVGKGDVIVWSNQAGVFAGASVSATDITSNSGEDRAYYGRKASTEDILSGKVRPQTASADRKLIAELPH